MQGLHRVEIRDIEKVEVKSEEVPDIIEEDKKTPQSYIVENRDDELGSEPQIKKTDEAETQKKQGSSSLTKEIIAILEAKRNKAQRSLFEEDQNFYLSATIKKIIEPGFDVDISLETKLKHLIDIYSKILYMNKGQIPLVNYNLQDANRIIDSLGGVLSSMGYYKKNELQEAFEILEVEERLNKIHILASKYLSFLQNFSDVGVNNK